MGKKEYATRVWTKPQQISYNDYTAPSMILAISNSVTDQVNRLERMASNISPFLRHQDIKKAVRRLNAIKKEYDAYGSAVSSSIAKRFSQAPEQARQSQGA